MKCIKAQTKPNKPTQLAVNDSGFPVSSGPKTLSMTDANQSPFAANSLIKEGSTGINTPKERTSNITETRINQMAALRGVFKVTADPWRGMTFKSSIVNRGRPRCETAKGYHELRQSTTERYRHDGNTNCFSRPDA